jgi:hypothetical protein
MVWVNRRIIAFAVAFLGGLAFIIYSFVTIEANESLIYVAVVVAACAAIASLLSFQWARDTIRPFVYFRGDIDVGGTEANKHITFHIGNSGQIPASNVRINIVPFGIEEEMTIGNIGKIYSFPKGRDELIMIFPTRGFQWVEEFDMKKPEEKGI